MVPSFQQSMGQFIEHFLRIEALGLPLELQLSAWAASQ